MSNFGAYSRYYDLLYRDKDYRGESEFIQKLIQKYSPNASTLLELGCGTGVHAALLAQQGYHVRGLDQSEEMLHMARRRQDQLPFEEASRLSFFLGDARSVRLGVEVDGVLALFHVMSYQTTNADLEAAFETARAHLAPGGIFLFDCWYGPAVLTDRPAIRVKSLEDESIGVIRIAEPALRPNDNLVDVTYRILVKDKTAQTTHEIGETHHMRYLFTPEIKQLMNRHGFELIESCEWMTGNRPGFDTWSVCFIGRV